MAAYHAPIPMKNFDEDNQCVSLKTHNGDETDEIIPKNTMVIHRKNDVPGGIQNGGFVKLCVVESDFDVGGIESFDRAEGEEDLRCGCGNYRPSWLQRCNNPKAFLAALSFFSFVQSFAVHGVNYSNVSTLEKRFGLSSSQTGLIQSIYDVAVGVTGFIISYVFAKSNKARLLAIAPLIMALGSFTMFLPYVTEEPMKPEETSLTNLCSGQAQDNSTGCSESDGYSNYLYMYVFLGGQILHGIGAAFIYTSGVLYLDENVPADTVALYIAITFAIANAGAAAGFLFAGQLLDIYVDVLRVDMSSISVVPGDPNFIGAWWIGYIMSAAMFLISIPFLVGFQHELPGAAKIRRERISQAHASGTTTANRDPSVIGLGDVSFSDFIKSSKTLLKNPVFVCMAVLGIPETVLGGGFVAFAAKIIQVQHHQTARWSSLLSGFIAIPSAIIGQVIAGVISRKWKLEIKGQLLVCIASFVLAMASSLAYLIHCPSNPVVGINTSYITSYNSDALNALNRAIDVQSTCNMDCGCSLSSYDPLCGEDGEQYISPCHAGCMTKQFIDNTHIYHNCSCVGTNFNSSTSGGAVGGSCDNSCSMLTYFIPPLIMFVCWTLFPSPLFSSITMRCVPADLKSFAYGFVQTFPRLIGLPLGPVIVGAIIDDTCTIWQEQCGERGSCWTYDNGRLARNLTITAVSLKVVSLFFCCLGLFLYKAPSKSLRSKEEDPLSEQEISSSSKVHI